MFYMSIPYLDLDHVYKSGQVLTWTKVGEGGKYIIVHKDKIVQVEQKRNHFTFSCSEEDFYNTWYDYFDIGTDYLDLHYTFCKLDKDIEALCNRASGIRIIKQDMLQAIITSILLEDGRSPDTARMYMNNIVRACGKKRKNSVVGQVVTWHEFPSVDDIIRKLNRVSDKDIGHDKGKILSLCNDIKDGWLSITEDYSDYYYTSGVFGDFSYLSNCAENICLLGGHHLCAYPADCATDEFIGDNFFMNSTEFYDTFICKQKHVENAGYLLQVIKYNKYNPPRRL